MNQSFSIPGLDNDEAARVIAEAIREQDPGAVVHIDTRLRLVRVMSRLKAELLAHSIAASGFTVGAWVDELPWADSTI